MKADVLLAAIDHEAGVERDSVAFRLQVVYLETVRSWAKMAQTPTAHPRAVVGDIVSMSLRKLDNFFSRASTTTLVSARNSALTERKLELAQTLRQNKATLSQWRVAETTDRTAKLAIYDRIVTSTQESYGLDEPGLVWEKIVALVAPETATTKGGTSKSIGSDGAGRKIALVVGVQDYDDPTIKDLEYSQSDAEAVSDFLLMQGYQVRLLTSAAQQSITKGELRVQRASLTNLQEALVWLSDSDKDDQVVFYFSGHGSDEDNPLGDVRGFLLPADSKLTNLPGTALPVSAIRSALRRSKARKLALILDSCFAAGVKSVSWSSNTKAAGITNNLAFGSGRVSLFSSRDTEASKESKLCKHGYFTCHLLRAWGTGLRDANDVYNYVYQRVTNETKKKQHPRLDFDEAEGNVPTY